MAQRFNSGWFDVHPRYSAGSPAMVDMTTALSVARDEVKMFQGVAEGTWGPEDQATARLLGLRGIVEWKREAGAGSIIAYDLLTRTWHLYLATDVTGLWERGNHLRYTRPHGYNVAPAKVRVEAAGRKKFNVWKEDTPDSTEHTLPIMWCAPESEVREFLSWAVYRKDAPERAQQAHRDMQRQLDEAMEDAGVKA